MALITAKEARSMATSIDVDKLLAPEVDAAVSKICHSVRFAAQHGEFKITYIVEDHLFGRIDDKLQKLGFGSRKAFWFFKPGFVKIVVSW